MPSFRRFQRVNLTASMGGTQAGARDPGTPVNDRERADPLRRRYCRRHTRRTRGRPTGHDGQSSNPRIAALRALQESLTLHSTSSGGKRFRAPQAADGWRVCRRTDRAGSCRHPLSAPAVACKASAAAARRLACDLLSAGLWWRLSRGPIELDLATPWLAVRDRGEFRRPPPRRGRRHPDRARRGRPHRGAHARHPGPRCRRRDRGERAEGRSRRFRLRAC